MAGRGRSAGSVRVDVVASNAKFDKTIKASQTRLQKFQRSAEKGARKLQSLWKQSALALGGIATAALAAAKKMADYSSSVVETSRVVGLTTKELENLRKLLEGDGIGVKKADRALKDFNVRVGFAQRGIGQYTRAFEELGIELRNADGSFKSNSKLLTEVAGKLQDNTNHAEAASIAYELFGTSGRDLLPILQAHGEALDENAKKAGRFNTLTTEQHEKNKKLGQNITDLKNNLWDLAMRVMVEYADEMINAIKNTNDWVLGLKNADGWIKRVTDRINNAVVALRTFTGILVGMKVGFSAGTAMGGPVGAAIGTVLGATLGASGINALGEWVGEIFGSQNENALKDLRDNPEFKQLKAKEKLGGIRGRGLTKDERLRLQEFRDREAALMRMTEASDDAIQSFNKIWDSFTQDEQNAETKKGIERLTGTRPKGAGLNVMDKMRLVDYNNTLKPIRITPEWEIDPWLAMEHQRRSAFMDSQGNDVIIRGGPGMSDRRNWREEYDYNARKRMMGESWHRQRAIFRVSGVSAAGDPDMAFGDRWPEMMSPSYPMGGRAYAQSLLPQSILFGSDDQALMQRLFSDRTKMAAPSSMIPSGLVGMPTEFRPEEQARMKRLLEERIELMQTAFTDGMIKWTDRMTKKWEDTMLTPGPDSIAGDEGRMFAQNLLQQRRQSGMAGGRWYGAQGTNALRLAQSDAQALGFFRKAGESKPNEQFESFIADMNDIKALAGDLEMSFSNFTHSLISDFKNAGEAARALARDILKIATQRMIVNPVTDLLFGGADGSGGSGIFGSMASAFVGAFADGGRAGRGLALVGERGPELVDFSQPGMVYNTEQLGAALRGNRGGAPTIQFNINSTDGPGVRAAIAEATPMIVNAANAQMMESTNRVGATRTIMQGRR